MTEHADRRARSKRATAAWVAAVSAVAVAAAVAGGAYAAHSLRDPGSADAPTTAPPSASSTTASNGPSRTGSPTESAATPPSAGRHAASRPAASTPAPASPSASASVPADYTFPIADCPVTYGATHHDYPAADMFAARGCLFVAPVDGRIDEVTLDDTWTAATNAGPARGGRSVSLVGVDGVRYYGSHLEAVLPGIRPGVEVAAGEPLGRVGDSGSAAGTGTHLHFAISWPTPPGYWWIRRGTVLPQPYVDSWRSGGHASPVDAVDRARAAYGDDARCHAYC